MTSLVDLIKQREQLDKLIQDTRLKERASAITEVVGLISQYQITPQECGFSGKSAKQKPAAQKKVAIKYRSSDGKTWTGRGKPPRWISEYESSGRSREDFRI